MIEPSLHTQTHKSWSTFYEQKKTKQEHKVNASTSFINDCIQDKYTTTETLSQKYFSWKEKQIECSKLMAPIALSGTENTHI